MDPSSLVRRQSVCDEIAADDRDKSIPGVLAMQASVLSPRKWKSLFGKLWARTQEEEAQGVSEYAVLLVLLVLIVVATVHAIGMNAQHVIDRVNTALHG
jgi:Flp pilus assembly pilin Flp